MTTDTTYADQWDTLKVIRLKEGQYLRLDCPFCSGLNSFGIQRNAGVVSWGCFRASCQAKGKHDVGFTRAGIRTRLDYDPSIRSSNENAVNRIPDPLLSIDNRDDIIAWLSSVNSLLAYNEGLVSIKYSPTEDRVLFKVPDHEGYTGRAIQTLSGLKSHWTGPKWKKYGDTSSIFSCGSGEIGVIVEDAPSACAVGTVPGLTGASLLGTMLTTQHKVNLRRFKRLIVCLDPDAALKSLSFAKRLQGLGNVSVKFIKDDLKYFTPDQIEGMLL